MRELVIKIAYACLKIYWRFFKPVTMGTRVLVMHEDSVLLVRLTYHRGWFLPGGAVDRGESFLQSAKRELQEECGIQSEDFKLMGLYIKKNEGKIDHIAVYQVGKFTGELKPQNKAEIQEVRFFPVRDLPSDLLPGHRRRIEESLGLRPSTDIW